MHIGKNIDISSYMCSGSYPYTLSFKSVYNILFLYLEKFWKNRLLIWRLFFKNTVFVYSQNFYITKIVQNICNMFWFLIKHVCISKCITELICRIYGILLKVKRQVFNPYKMLDWPSVGRPSFDRMIDRTRSRLTTLVDRCVQTCTAWAGRPHGRPTESLCSL